MPEQTPTPKEIRHSLINQIDESKKVIAELSDEELEEVAGGISFGAIGRALKSGYDKFSRHGGFKYIDGAVISTTLMPSGSSSDSSSGSSTTQK